MSKRKAMPAAKPIKAVLAEFLAEQQQRLKPKTFGRYEAVIELFESSMDGYAYQGLDEEETALWEERFNDGGEEHREFCEIFGPEKIPENVGEFLGYFMPHKVICGQDLLRAAGTVTKKLSRWLAEKGYVDEDPAASMGEHAARAAKDLPAAEALCRQLAEHAAATTDAVTEELEGHFDVRALGTSSLALEDSLSGERMTVPVPRAAAAACQPGWQIVGCVGKTARGWQFVDVWNVYT